MFGLSKSTILRRIKSGAFPSVRSEGRRLILKDGLARRLRCLASKAAGSRNLTMTLAELAAEDGGHDLLARLHQSASGG